MTHPLPPTSAGADGLSSRGLLVPPAADARFATRHDFPRDLTMPVLLAARAAQSPDTVFMTDAGRDVAITHAQLHDLSLRWASALRDGGVTEGDTVVTLMPSGHDAIAVWIGLSWLRAIEVTVNEEYTGSMLAYILRDSAARTLITHESMLPAVDSVIREVPAIERVVVITETSVPEKLAGDIATVTDMEFLGTADPLESFAPPRASDTSVIVYTSGTTGPSKGVMLPWRQMIDVALWCVPFDHLTEQDVAYLPFPSFHVSFRAPVFSMLMKGAPVITRRRFSPTRYWTDVQRFQATYGPMLGSMATLLQHQPEQPGEVGNTLRLTGMVPVLPDADGFRRRFGVQIGTLYNMTEMNVPILSPDWDAVAVDGVNSCGRVREGVEVRLVDEWDEEVPEGQPGELIIRSSEPWALNAGYWGKSEATAQAWRNGWFHTGDVLRRDADGNYFFVDRANDAIRRRGENISSLEVEKLVGMHPAVAEVAAVGVASQLGEEDVLVVVSLSPGADATYEDLAAHNEAHLPRFMRPRYIDIVSELPHTATGKVQKAALRAAGLSSTARDVTSATGAVTR